MRVAVIKQHGSYDFIQFEDQPVPHPKENEYLIRIKACGLNHLDIWVRKGVPGHQFPLPIIPGSDIAGVVEKTGAGAKLFHSGDRVLINPLICCGHCRNCLSGQDHLCSKFGLLGETTNGGCCDAIVVHERQLLKLPAQLTFEQAACIPIAYLTAWEMLVKKARVKFGESILIHAAGSGVSIACIQIARLMGLQIFVTSTSDEKLQRAKNLGAHRFINSSKENFKDAIRNHTAKQGVDVVVDHIGEKTIMDSIRCLKKGGRLVSCGATTGAEITIDWKHVFFKNISLLGSTYGSSGDLLELLKLFERGHLTPVVDSVVKLENLAQAHQAIEEHKVFGKIVVSL